MRDLASSCTPASWGLVCRRLCRFPSCVQRGDIVTLILDPTSEQTTTSRARWAGPQQLHGPMRHMAEDRLDAVLALRVKNPLRNAR